MKHNEYKVNPANYDNTCYIVAGGPSLKNFDWKLLTPDKFVIAINRSYEVLPDAQVVYYTDRDFWDRHKQAMLAHKGQLMRGVLHPQKEKEHPRIILWHLTGPHGYETTPGKLKHGSNSTHAALNLAAAHFGFKKIYILGLDMKWGQKNNKKTSHWHDGHKRIDPENAYKKMSKAYDLMAPMLKTAGVEVYNVNTPEQTALRAFPIVSVQEVFKK